MNETEQQSSVAIRPRRQLSTVLLLVCAAGTLLGGGAIGGVLLAKRQPSIAATVPANIAANLDFTPVLPDRLPGSYEVVPGSFRTAEDAKVLLFQARDTTGATIDFSEQRRPGKNFDFDNFYSGQIKDVHRLIDDSKTEAVWGRSMDGRTALSVATSEIWTLVFTSSSLDEPSLQQIARGLSTQ